MATKKKTKKKAPVYRSNRDESRLAEARVERAAVQVLAGMCAGLKVTDRFGEDVVRTLVARAIDVAEELVEQLDGLDEDDEDDEDEDDEDDLE